MKRIFRITLVMFCFGLLARAQAPPLKIVEETLPTLDVGVETHLPLHATGGVPPYRWSVASGSLPEGISLTPEGVLVGRVAEPGTISFTMSVEDSAKNRITKDLQTKVVASLLFQWLRPPQVHGAQMDGAVQLSNGTKDDFDLTFIVVAIAENGRATALGYQHFSLKAGTSNFQIPFGQTLPHGAYVVHADAVAEIPAKNVIIRRLLETPSAITVVQGP